MTSSIKRCPTALSLGVDEAPAQRRSGIRHGSAPSSRAASALLASRLCAATPASATNAARPICGCSRAELGLRRWASGLVGARRRPASCSRAPARPTCGTARATGPRRSGTRRARSSRRAAPECADSAGAAKSPPAPGRRWRRGTASSRRCGSATRPSSAGAAAARRLREDAVVGLVERRDVGADRDRHRQRPRRVLAQPAASRAQRVGDERGVAEERIAAIDRARVACVAQVVEADDGLREHRSVDRRPGARSCRRRSSRRRATPPRQPKA